MFAFDPNLSIRRARPEDAPGLLALARCSFEMYIPRMGREPTPMTDDYATIIHRDFVWIVEGPDGFVAAMVLCLKPESMLLDLLTVRPDYQGKGLGGAMMEMASIEAVKFGHDRITLYTHETMTENLALYSARGFEETHREEFKGGHVVYMAKKLALAHHARMAA